MITFFTHCRPFEDEFEEIQLTAISSWLSMGDNQVVLIGEHGLDEAARLGIDHHPLSRYNEYGTALVCDIFAIGEHMAKHELLCEISSDIVLSGDSMSAFRAIRGIKKPLMIGRRWDITPGDDEPILHAQSAVDYFVFKAQTLGEIPPFAVGRTAYDNWLVWAALTKWHMTVIDATEDVFALHLNHGYPEYGDKQKMRQSAERKNNLDIAKKTGMATWPGTDAAEYMLKKGKFIPR